MGTAIFYDTENIGLTANAKAAGNIDVILERIKTSPLVDKIVLQRGYSVGNRNGHNDQEAFSAALKKHDIEMVQIQDIPTTGKKKPNQVDLKMCVDIPIAVMRSRSITTVVLVTGDGDFRFLLEELRARNKKILLVSAGNVTSLRLVHLCDDWIDVHRRELPAKEILSIWKEHLADRNYRDQDFMTALCRFLDDSEKDPLLARFIREGAISIVLLRSLFGSFANLPNHQTLGYKTWTDLLSHAFSGSNYCLKLNKQQNQLYLYPRELKDLQLSAEPYRPVQMYKKLIGFESCYSSKRMRQWIKNLSRYSQKQLGELLYYIEFMRQNDLIIKENDGTYRLPDENYAQKVIERLSKQLRGAGCPPQEDALRELEELLEN